MRLPSLQSLQAMTIVARTGSLAAASTQIGMSVSTLSRNIKALEDRLGVRLFDRHARGVILTKAGEEYYAAVSDALALLENAADILNVVDTGSVTISTIPAFATRWLIPRLNSFRKIHPDIDVRVRTSIHFENLDETNTDLAVRLAPSDTAIGQPFLPVHLMPVFSEAHFRAIHVPADVMRHTLLSPDHRPEFWHEWLREYDISPSDVKITEVDSLLLYALAERGEGIAIGIEPLVSEVIVRGTLSGLADHRIRSRRSFHLVTRSLRPTRQAKLFSDWLLREAKRSV